MPKLSITNLEKLDYSCEEAINTLCTNLSFSGSSTRKIVFTSCVAHEGKSFITINVMRTMASLGYKTVLIDADLRKSALNKRYDIQGANIGLSHYLAGKAQMADVIYETNIPNAFMVPVGVTVSNPLPLLNTPLFGELLDLLSQHADYIIVDVPPVGTVIDAAQIAKFCDGAVIVVKYNSIPRRDLIEVKRQMEQTQCPIIGTVLSMVEYDSFLSKKYYHKSYYNYSYSDDTDENGWKRRVKHKVRKEKNEE